jgi:hypothetical protein
MLKAAEELAFACEEKTLNECLNCFSQNPDCSGGALVNNLHQAATGDCPIAMERFNEAKKLVEPNNNTWHRVGDLEVAPVDMWERMEWDNGWEYCQAHGYVMPDKKQLQAIFRDSTIEELIVHREWLYRDVFWTSSEELGGQAWGQSPQDRTADVYAKSNRCVVVPCRKAATAM